MLLPLQIRAQDMPIELQFTQLLASNVPSNTTCFTHPLLSTDCKTLRSSAAIRTGAQRPRKSHAEPHHPLLQYLLRFWDECWRRSDPQCPVDNSCSAVPQSWVEIGTPAQYVSVSLARNRYCMCKGSAHKSNGVYLVVDLLRKTFHQKCYDTECRHFRSESFQFPSDMPAWPTPMGACSSGAGDECGDEAASDACNVTDLTAEDVAWMVPVAPRVVMAPSDAPLLAHECEALHAEFPFVPLIVLSQLHRACQNVGPLQKLLRLDWVRGWEGWEDKALSTVEALPQQDAALVIACGIV